MSRFEDLIQGFLDETLTDEEQQELAAAVRSDRKNADCFAKWMMLHDRLGNERRAVCEIGEEVELTAAIRPRSRWTRVSVAVAACSLLITASVLWTMVGVSTASAAVTEINRLIATSARPIDRVYRIRVLGLAENRPSQPADAAERQRPPKPPLDGAELYVRPDGQFVLVCRAANGDRFLTGSNGRSSWSVGPSGAARFSDDVAEFRRDVPGHEHQIPLSNIHQGLEHLRDAYDLHLLPGGTDESSDHSSTRLLVAVKRRGDRGPDRVEIAYEPASGEIQSLQFVGMPYGPDWLNVQVSLVETRDLGPGFFDYEAHFDSRRPVRKE